MICSGDIADAALYNAAEKNFLLRPSVRKRYGILHYSRFKDDGLIIVDGKVDLNLLSEMFGTFRELAYPFTIKLETVGRKGFQMLDLAFSKGERFDVCSCLDFCLFTKPTSIWKPLSPESMHPASVHMHWPIAQCNRIRKRFSCYLKAETAVQTFESKLFAANGVTVESWVKRPRSICSTSWMVLPFDFCLGSSRVMSTVKNVVVPESIWSVLSQVKISWKLGNKRLMHLLRPSAVAKRGMVG